MSNYKLYKEKMRSESQRPLVLIAIEKILRDMNVSEELAEAIRKRQGAA